MQQSSNTDQNQQPAKQKQKQTNTVTETNIRISEDKKWILFIKTETTFYRSNYISAILNSEKGKNKSSPSNEIELGD